MNQSAPVVLAVDTGGTFTDYLALFESGEIHSGKIPSTPDDPSRSIRVLFQELEVDDDTTFIHGTTVATNALLEDEMADVLLVTNYGLEGLLTIGRGHRKELYHLNPDPGDYPFQDLPVVGVRLRDHPMIEDPGCLSDEEAARLRDEIRTFSVDLISVCLVHSYRNPDQEQAVQRALKPLNTPVICSADIIPRFREVQRASGTVLNAGLRPIISEYLQAIEDSEPTPGSVRVMGSSRGSLSVKKARTVPIRTALSGPAGGLLGARAMVPGGDQTSLITLDIGGTSTDVSLLPEGPIPLRDDHEIGTYSIGEPMVDIHTIGSGGGSVLWIDGGGHLRVGPRSAGADPGPACYGRGGPATVTDLLVFMGRIPTDRPLSNDVTLDKDLAKTSITGIANQMNQSAVDLAQGAMDIVLSQLSEALRTVTVKRGTSPEGIPLVAFGGGGGLHGALLAERLQIDEVYVPRRAGIASARGLLAAPDCHKETISPMKLLDSTEGCVPGESILRERGPGWGDQADSVEFEASCQFRGQNHVLDVPFTMGSDPDNLADQFRKRYQDRYGYLPSEDRVEVVHLRGFWFRKRSRPTINTVQHENRDSVRERQHLLTREGRQSVERHKLETTSAERTGPAIYTGETTTLYLPHGWRVEPERAVVRLIHDG